MFLYCHLKVIFFYFWFYLTFSLYFELNHDYCIIWFNSVKIPICWWYLVLPKCQYYPFNIQLICMEKTDSSSSSLLFWLIFLCLFLLLSIPVCTIQYSTVQWCVLQWQGCQGCCLLAVVESCGCCGCGGNCCCCKLNQSHTTTTVSHIPPLHCHTAQRAAFTDTGNMKFWVSGVLILMMWIFNRTAS